MRLLVDECLPRRVTRTLVEAGHDVADVRDIGLRGAPDEQVYARALEDRRVLVSSDLDFANAVRFPPGSHPGIVVLRAPTMWSPTEQAKRLGEALDTMGADVSGTIAIVEANQVRIFGGAVG